MFFAGGTFGHESEVRDANRHPTGRRHQPRDMTVNTGGNNAAVGGAGATANGGPERHANDQKQMSSGPSFMDRMFVHDASASSPAHVARRHKSGPRDSLNVFSWQETVPAQKSPAMQAGDGPRAARNVDNAAAAAVPTVEDRRAQESKKFEAHSESTFLKFSDTPSAGQPVGAGKSTQRVLAQAPRESGMMDELMRDQHERPHGKRIHAAQQATGRQKRVSAAEDGGVAGFPGMGQRSTPRAVPHLNRKQVESHVFPPSLPPWAQQHDGEADRRCSEGPREATPSAPAPASKQPSYQLDDNDYEDRHYAEGGDDAVGNYPEHQRRIHEMEIHDEDGDHGDYATAVPQQQQGGRPQPRWLEEPEESGGRHGDVSTAPQRCYDFDPHAQEFREYGGGDGHHREYRST